MGPDWGKRSEWGRIWPRNMLPLRQVHRVGNYDQGSVRNVPLKHGLKWQAIGLPSPHLKNVVCDYERKHRNLKT